MLARCPRPPAWLVAVCFFSYIGCARSHFLGEPDAATEEPDGGRDTDPDAGPNTMQDASADHAFPMRDADLPDLGPWTAPGVATPSGDVFCGPPTASDVRVDLVARGDQLWLLIASASGWSVHARSDAGYRLIASGEEPSVRRAAAAPDGRFWVLPYGACAVAEVSTGTPRCEFALADALEGARAGENTVAMSVVSDTEQWIATDYAILRGGNAGWGMFRRVSPNTRVRFRDIWGDRSLVSLVGDVVGVSFVDMWTNSLETRAPGAPGGDFTRVHGTDRSHLWFGTADGRLVQYDEPGWVVHRTATVRDGCEPSVRGVWAGGQQSAYYVTGHELGLVDANAPATRTVLLEWSCASSTTLEGVTGGAPDADVFVAAVDRQRLGSACGPVVLLRIDGQQVWRL